MPKSGAEKIPSIFVPRQKLSNTLTLGTVPISDADRGVLVDSLIKKWPDYYEMHDRPLVKSTLESIGVSWTDKRK